MSVELFPQPQGISFDEFYAILQRDGKCCYVHFTKKRARLFSALLKCKNRPLSVDDAYNAVYFDTPECDQPECRSIIQSMFCQMRKMVHPFDIDIVNLRDYGWCLIDREDNG